MSASLAGCTADDCLAPTPCCASCDEGIAKRRCGCAQHEVSALECPQRSVCALDYFVGDEPARCCRGACESLEIYRGAEGRCEAGDFYLHECAPESGCFQTYRAEALGTVYLPWQVEHSGSGLPLTGLWASASDEAWAVGSRGRVLHLREGRWQPQESGTTEDLTAVWGSSAQDVWVVGRAATMLHYDGSRWARVEAPTGVRLHAIEGSSSERLWVAGAAGVLLRHEGADWLVQEVPTDDDLLALAVTAVELWVGTARGKVLSFDGVQWREESLPASSPVLGLWRADDAVWAVGPQGGLFRRRGDHGWEVVQPELTGGDLYAIWGGAGQLWAVGERGLILRREDDRWEIVTYFGTTPGPGLLAIGGSETTVWVAGTGGVILRHAASAE